MDGQPPAVHVVGLIAQQICELGLQNGNDKVKGRIGVAHNEEQSRFLISDSIKLHFVIHHQVTQLLDVKGASLAPQEINILLAVFPVTKCQ